MKKLIYIYVLILSSFFSLSTRAQGIANEMYGDTIFYENFGTGVGLWASFSAAGLNPLGQIVGYEGYDFNTQKPNTTFDYNYSPYGGDCTITNSTDVLISVNEKSHGGWIVAGMNDRTPGDIDGRMFLADGATRPSVVFQRKITELCRNSEFEFSFWAAFINKELDHRCRQSSAPHFQMEFWSKDPTLGLDKILDSKSDTKKVAYLKDEMSVGVEVESAEGGLAQLLGKEHFEISTCWGSQIGTCRAEGDLTFSHNGDTYLVYKDEVSGKFVATKGDGLYYYVNFSSSTGAISLGGLVESAENFIYPTKYRTPAVTGNSAGLLVYHDGNFNYAIKHTNGKVYKVTNLQTIEINERYYVVPKFVKKTNLEKDSKMIACPNRKQRYQVDGFSGPSEENVYAYVDNGEVIFWYKDKNGTCYYLKPRVPLQYGEEYMSLSDMKLTSSFDYPCDVGVSNRWEHHKGIFKLQNQEHVFMILRNFNPNSGGNDFAIDDIVFRPYSRYDLDLDFSASTKATACNSIVSLRSDILITEENKAIISKEIQQYSFYFEGFDGEVWVRINESPLQIQSVDDPLEINMTLTEYNLYEKIRTVVQASSNSNGKCKTISSLEKIRENFPDSPMLSLEGEDLCIDVKKDVNGNDLLDADGKPIPDISGDEKGIFVIKNLNQRNNEYWTTKVELSDGTVMVLSPELCD